jgi:hypothetical protein
MNISFLHLYITIQKRHKIIESIKWHGDSFRDHLFFLLEAICNFLEKRILCLSLHSFAIISVDYYNRRFQCLPSRDVQKQSRGPPKMKPFTLSAKNVAASRTLSHSHSEDHPTNSAPTREVQAPHPKTSINPSP